LSIWRLCNISKNLKTNLSFKGILQFIFLNTATLICSYFDLAIFTFPNSSLNILESIYCYPDFPYDFVIFFYRPGLIYFVAIFFYWPWLILLLVVVAVAVVVVRGRLVEVVQEVGDQRCYHEQNKSGIWHSKQFYLKKLNS
jgi:hypothetical protein